MRRILLAAAVVIGALSVSPAVTIAAPVSTVGLVAAPTDIATAQYGYGRRHWRGGRRWDRPGRGYGRRFGGPPPFARAYGRRAHDRSYRR